MTSKIDKAIRQLSVKDFDRLMSKVKVNEETKCWEWQAARTKFGHGVFTVKSQWCSAHRVMFFAANGYLPEKPNLVMHDCENARCINPAHLLEGDSEKNGRYPGAITKFREGIRNKSFFGKTGPEHVRWGMKHSNGTKIVLRERAKNRTKLSDEDVRAVFNSKESSNVLAKKYGVSGRLIRCIREGTKRRHASGLDQ